MKITFGWDPEVHLMDMERGGRVVSSIPVIKRDKHNPVILGDGIKFYADNVLAEIASPPVMSPEEAVESFRRIFQHVRSFLGKRYSLLAKAAHVYDAEELGPRREGNPAWETGCNPNLGAYIESQNPKVEFKDGMRTGSFHIHLGHPKLKTMFQKADAVKLLDIYVGCASVLFDKDPSALVRRKYYGQAGEFRDTEYGIEWRVLGNYPLRSPEMTRLVFDLVDYAAGHITKGSVKDVINIKGIQQDTQLAINTNDKSAARKVLDKAGLPSMLLTRSENQEESEASLEQAWGVA